jgi:deoxyribodipyrimidine photo-lyase
MPHKYFIFIHTRDLREYDNTTLHKAYDFCRINKCKLLPIFIFDPTQYGKGNKFRSVRALKFLCECLEDIPVNIFEGKTRDVLNDLIEDFDILGIGINQDYTPFAKDREHMIEKICKSHDIEFMIYQDYPLMGGISILGKEYKKFSAFYGKARKIHVLPDYSMITKGRYKVFKEYSKIPKEVQKIIKDVENPIKGGAEEAKKQLAKIPKNYNDTHNYLGNKTSQLSAYIKFGCISIRRVYHYASGNLHGKHKEAFIRQLYWRDFYMQLMYYRGFEPLKQSPTLKWGRSGKNMKVPYDKKAFALWCNGRTEDPLVNRLMQELRDTGMLHNRARLIVASYLIHYLEIHWTLGEKYFAQTLIDYDPASNFGNWTWIAGVGADFMTHRYFNPKVQARKYDKKV